jgi:hypothetical protein
MQDGALVMNQGLVSAKEWKLEKIRNPSIDGMNYHQTAISLAKNDNLSRLWKKFMLNFLKSRYDSNCKQFNKPRKHTQTRNFLSPTFSSV